MHGAVRAARWDAISPGKLLARKVWSRSDVFCAGDWVLFCIDEAVARLLPTLNSSRAMILVKANQC